MTDCTHGTKVRLLGLDARYWRCERCDVIFTEAGVGRWARTHDSLSDLKAELGETS